MAQYHDELTKITFKILKFAELSNDDLRGAVSQKIVLLSEKADSDLETVKKAMTSTAEKTNKHTTEQFKQHLEKNITNVQAEMRGLIADRQKEMLRTVRAETETKIVCEVRDRLQVPGLVGENCLYSTLPSFLMSWHAKGEQETSAQRTNIAAMLTRIGMLENRVSEIRRDKDMLEKELTEKFTHVERENSRLKNWLSTTKDQIKKVEYECKPFSETEITKMKDLVNIKWEQMS